MGSSAINYTQALKIYVPNAEVDTYKTVWSNFSGSIYSISIINNDFAIVDDVLIQYLGVEENVIIPYGITEIGDYAFYKKYSLVNVSIPETVRKIGDYAFSDCINLTNVEYLGTAIITTIGEYAFSDCRKLINVNIPDLVTSIGERAFYNCYNIEHIVLGNSVANIGDEAFYNSHNLNSVIINRPTPPELGSYIFNNSYRFYIYVPHDNLSAYKDAESWQNYNNRIYSQSIIDENGFAIHNGMLIQYLGTETELVIPDNVVEIYEYAFNKSNIISITIPSSVISIGYSAFYQSRFLSSVFFAENSQLISIGEAAFSECSNLNSIIIPNSVKSIGTSAFYLCENLVSVIFQDGIELDIIDDNTFLNCYKLKTIDIPDSVIRIGDNAFEYCENLLEIKLGENSKLSSIGSYAFINTAWLDSQASGVVYINKIAYCYKGDMPENTSISLLEDTIAIADGAFNNENNLKGIVIPENVVLIGARAFEWRSNFNSVVFTGISQLKVIEEYAFAGTNITSIILPDSLIEIGEYAFGNCYNLEFITFSYNLVIVGNRAFHNTKWYNDQAEGVVYTGSVAYRFKGNDYADTIITLNSNTLGIAESFFDSSYINLKGFIMNEGLKYIPNNAFYGIELNFTIPSTVEFIGEYAFYNATYLNKLVFKSEMPPVFGGEILNDSNYLNFIIVPANSYQAYYNCPQLSNYTDIIYASDDDYFIIDNVLICYNGTERIINIPQGVEKIGDYAFFGDIITSVNMPDSVIEIGDYVFYFCYYLTTVNIPDSVNKIGYCAFYECRNLTTVTFGENSQLVEIGDYCFAYCINLYNIILPDSVYIIGLGSLFETLWYNEQPNGLVYAGNILYRYKGYMSQNEELIIATNTKSIASYALTGLYELENIIIPQNVVYIGDNNFTNCTNLTEITVLAIIPPELGENVFTGSDNLTCIYVPADSVDDYKIAPGWSYYADIISAIV